MVSLCKSYLIRCSYGLNSMSDSIVFMNPVTLCYFILMQASQTKLNLRCRQWLKKYCIITNNGHSANIILIFDRYLYAKCEHWLYFLCGKTLPLSYTTLRAFAPNKIQFRKFITSVYKISVCKKKGLTKSWLWILALKIKSSCTMINTGQITGVIL